MKVFVIYILRYLIKMIFLVLTAFYGFCVGYRIKHRREIYFKKQRKQIAKRGKLIAYMYAHYAVVYKKRKNVHDKRNEKWLYEKCYNYAKKCDELDLKMAIAHLKSDITIFEVIAALIAICVGFSNQIVAPYAEATAMLVMGIRTTIGLTDFQIKIYDELNSSLQMGICIVFAFLLVVDLLKVGKILRKQQYLLCILETIGN